MSLSSELILVRHGETLWNRDRRLQGHIDIDLNEDGRRQAHAAGAALSRVAVAAVYASDLKRALHTGQAIADACGLPLTTGAQFRERSYGILEGHLLDELPAKFPVEYAAWQARKPDAVIEGGETLAAFYARIVDALTRAVSAHPGQTVVVVAHGGVLDCAYRAATATPLQAPRAWDLLNASINRLGYVDGRFVLRQWAEVTHLQNALGVTLDEVDRRFA